MPTIPLLDASGAVVNIVLADTGWTPDDPSLTIGPPGGQIGDRWNGADYERVPVVIPPPTQQDYADALQSHIDQTARSRGYADGAALATYATSTIPQWATEAQAFIAWRDAAWIYAYTALGLVQGGAEPPSIDEFVSAAPTIVWP